MKWSVFVVLVAISVFGVKAGPPLVPIEPSVKVADNEEGIQIRLINDTIPIHYDVTLETRIHERIFEYDGHVDILIKCVQATNVITLHSRRSTIEEITLRHGETVLTVTGHEEIIESEFLEITVEQALVVNEEYTLSITFTGQHTVDNFGWYRASYFDDSGKEVWFATTDFEAPDARQAFPCYDEPDHKATFAFQITNHKSYHAISNMPIISVVANPDGERTTTTFETTPAMSTYLLAFVVSDFASRCKGDLKGREQCVYVRPNGYDHSSWALETAIDGLLGLESLLNVDYTLPKMDQIAIPDKDFASGAMENWGLVTYRETRLLIDESDYRYTEKDSIGTVILHEFAHQWFGDLVTPKWWTYLWLNEGFATLFEYYATDLVYPDMRLPELMVLESVQGIMNSDATDEPRPMTHYVESNVAIRSLFNYVSYQKSGTVLRMMMLNLGKATFLKGLTYYLTEMSLKNAVAEDLFAGIQKAVDEDRPAMEGLTIKTIMDSWTLQGGYPIITVTRESDTTVSLTQKKFMLSNADPGRSTFYIPITYTTGSQADFESTVVQQWFRGDAEKLDISVNLAEDEWIIFNKQQSSFYRVNYDEATWWSIAKELKGDFNKIHLLNRAQLLDDSLDLAINDRLNVTIAIGIAEYLAHETDYVPWAAAETGLTYFYDRMVLTDFSDAFLKFTRGLVENLYKEYRIYGSEKSVYFRILARNLAYRWACKVENADCESDLASVMSRVINEDASLTKDYADSIPCAGMGNINDDDYLKYWAKFQATASPQATRNSMITLLACTHQDHQIDILLKSTIEGGVYSSGEKSRLFQAFVTKGQKYQKILLDFFEANADVIRSGLQSTDHQTLFNAFSAAAYSQDVIDRMKAFTEPLESNLGSTVIARMEANFVANLAWVEKYGNPINNYLENGSPTIIASTVIVLLSFLITLFNM